MTLHLSHIGFTDGLTFIFVPPMIFLMEFPEKRVFYDLLRQVILPLVKSYGLISSFTVSPSMIRM